MKNKFFDVVPPDRKSIRNVALPDRASERGEVHHHHSHTAHTASDNTKAEVFKKKDSIPDGYFSKIGKKKSGSLAKFIFAIIILLIISVGASFAFLKAEVTVTPSKSTATINASFMGKVDPAPNDVAFDTITYTTELSGQVKSGGEKKVSRKASGKIVIYNNFSTAPQALVKNTRFQSPSGKIYRIDKAINVPGIKTVSGKKIPGSIEATIYADVAGDSYNSKEVDFTIPGFASTPKFKSIYARSSSPIAGGFVGTENVVDEATSASTVLQLQLDLKKKLLADINVRMPKEFILVPGAASISYGVGNVTGSGEQSTITVKGTIKANILKKSDLDRIIENSKPTLPFTFGQIDSYDGLMLDIKSVSETSLTATITGKATVVARVDNAQIINAVKSHSKSTIGEIVPNHPELERIKVIVSPLWMPKLPSDPSKITLIVETQLTN